MESSIAEFLKRQLACELLPTTIVEDATGMDLLRTVLATWRVINDHIM